MKSLYLILVTCMCMGFDQALSQLALTSEDVRFSGKFCYLLRARSGKPFAGLREGEEVAIDKRCFIQGIMIGCYNSKNNLFFRRSIVPNVEKLASSKLLSQLESILGSPDPSGILSTSWAIDNREYDVRYWRVCSSLRNGKQCRLFLIAVVVSKTPRDQDWLVHDIEVLEARVENRGK